MYLGWTPCFYPLYRLAYPTVYSEELSYGEMLQSLLENFNKQLKKLDEQFADVYEAIGKDRDSILQAANLYTNTAVNNLRKSLNESIDVLSDAMREADDVLDGKITVLSQKVADSYAYIGRVEAKLQKAQDGYEAEIDGKISAITQTADGLAESVEKLKEYVDEQDTAYFQKVMEYLEEEVKKIKDIRNLYKISPFDGKSYEMQEILYQFFDVLEVFALTCDDMYELDLTCEGIEKENFTCLEMFTSKPRFYRRLFTWKRNPYTGLVESAGRQIDMNTLNIKHPPESVPYYALTASEYDRQDITAETYDMLKLTAYGYDWLGGYRMHDDEF